MIHGVVFQVKHNGFAVIHAHPELRRDPAVAFAAVSDRGFVLRYLEEDLKVGTVMMRWIKNGGKKNKKKVDYEEWR